jgi:hypothetical protein
MREVHHHGIQGECSGVRLQPAREVMQVSKVIVAREGGTTEEDGHTAKPGSLRCRETAVGKQALQVPELPDRVWTRSSYPNARPHMITVVDARAQERMSA